jgi:hypothetical protein
VKRRKHPRRGFARAPKPRKVAGVKNVTEQEHEDLHLYPMRAAGHAIEWWYEAVTLKLAPELRYTPDFVVLMADGSLVVHEVKGGLIRDDALAKLKMAAEKFPLRFEMWQKKPKKLGGGWTRTEIKSDQWAEDEAA